MKRRPAPRLVALLSIACSCSACGKADRGHTGLGTTPEADGDTAQLPPESSPAPLPGIAEEEGATGNASETDRLALGVSYILSQRCATCHDGYRSDGGLGDVHDLEHLITTGAIVPGSSASSPLVQGLLDGSQHPMTPRHTTPLTSGELALLASFIDRLPSTPPAACDPLAYRSSDEIYTALLADARAASGEDRPFLRYVGLTYASNGGSCGTALQRQRSALFKLVNSVSTAPEIHVPQAIDADGLLYRIDLRNYGWNRQMDLEDDGKPDFADGWLAIAAAAQPYALELAGPEADELKRLTGVEVPFLPANALVHAASAGDSYYALLGARRYGEATQLQLGVALNADRGDRKLRFAGFGVNSSLSVDRRVTRAEQHARPGLYYWRLDEWVRGGSETPFNYPDDPYGSEPALVIYSLPNGMQAYGIDGLDDSRLTEMPLRCLNAYCQESVWLNGAGCHACHESGLVSARDQLRELYEANAREIGDDEAGDIFRAAYPSAAEFARMLAEGSQLHLDALQHAGVTPGGPEPISFVYYQFERTALGLRRAAGELDATPEQLSAVLPSTSGRLGALLAPDGEIQRSTFDGAYLELRCALEAGSRNRPVACP